MAERKELSKKMRFEVFKRDSFTCQYCGKSAPDVILEVDHINPVYEGGTNDLLNLITSCRDCNRGKGKTKISDNAAITKQKKLLDDLNEKKEQMDMMLEWESELSELEEKGISSVECLVKSFAGRGLTDYGRKKIGGLIKKFGFPNVYESTEVSFDRYFNGSQESMEHSLKKIGGVCFNKEKKSERLNLLLTPTLKERLCEFSKGTGNSVNDIICKILEDFLERTG